MEHALKFGGWGAGATHRQKRQAARRYGMERHLGLWDRFIVAFSGYSVKAAAGALNYTWGKSESLAKPAKVFLALCTTIPTATSTGASIVEATGAVGYARKEVPVANISTATEANPSVIENTAELVFNNITSGEATVIGWALTDKAGTGEGNVIMWGTCTSTVISETQTPPTVATGKLKGEVKST